MKQDLRERLRRLGVTRGTRRLRLKSAGKTTHSEENTNNLQRTDQSESRLLEKMFPGGRLEDSGEGACFIIDRVYPLNFQHGNSSLAHLLDQPLNAAAVICGDDRFDSLQFEDLLFIDTETTGLSGAGSLAFMVGVAFFEHHKTDQVLVVRQFFLRDHGDEKAMLLNLDGLLEQKPALVSFNGRTFDIPLLNNRFLMNRIPSRMAKLPHFDLLSSSRRLWRHRIGSVALSNLERELLRVHRSKEDVPGWLIPGLYNDYLRSGDARELKRVFYHNQIDMLSMVTLAGEVLRQFSDSRQEDHPIDLYSLGKWQDEMGMIEEAERTLKNAASADLPLEYYHQVLRRLALLLKRNDRRQEALPYWQQWAATSFDSVEAFEELAKYYEWHANDLTLALTWTERGLELLKRSSRETAALRRPQLEHRQARLLRKLNRA